MATTYYVNSVSGDDSANGSAGTPWQTLAHAVSNALAADTIVFQDTGPQQALGSCVVDVPNKQTRAVGILPNSGIVALGGILDGAGDFHQRGLFDRSGNYYASGTLDGAGAYIGTTPGAVNGLTYVYDNEGNAVSGATILLKMYGHATAGIAADTSVRSAVSDSYGLVVFTGLIPGASYMVRRGTASRWTPQASGDYTLEESTREGWTKFTIPANQVSDYAIPAFCGEDVGT